jgi:serine/threonine protein kinase
MLSSLGKYELIEELNSGSMGTVYIARDKILDRKVALKTVLPGAHLDDELKERFYREARACARLQHPSIITIYDFGEENGTAYIAMELLTGTDVRRLIAERRPLPLDVKLDIGAMICEGLDHAHSQGIVHRDIKPSNLFVTEDGRAKILDFGIARTATSSLTMVGRVLGTPNYMAPEQILGKPCDARSDLFSVGIVLFEFIAGSHPFRGESIPRRIVREAPDDLRSALPGAPPEITSILAKALEKKPEARYQSGKDFAADLRAAAVRCRGGASGSSSHPSAVAPELFAAPSAPLPAAAPLAGEGTEVRMSRVLTALQEFDEAVEAHNVPAARRAFEAVRTAALGDDRFEGAVKSSQERLYELERTFPTPPAEPSTPQPPPAQGESTQDLRPNPFEASQLFESPALSRATPPAPTPSTPPPPASVQAAPPPPPPVQAAPPAPQPAAEYGGGDATQFFDASAIRTQPRPAAPAPPPAATPPAPAPAPQAAPPARKPEPPPATPAPKPAARPQPAPAAPAPPVAAAPFPPPAPAAVPSPAKTILVVGAAVVVLILAAGGYFLFTHRRANAAPMPAVATAVVTAAQTGILERPAKGEASIVQVPKGTLLQVLRVPRSSSQDWVEVQYVTPARVYPSGFARTSDLGDWKSSKPDAALVLLRAFEPPPGAGVSDIEAQLAKLNAFTQQFAGTPQEAEARLDIARWNVELARAAGSAGQPDAAFIQAARDNLAQAAGRPDLSAKVAQIQQDLASLTTAQGSLHTPGEAPAMPTDLALKRAQTAYDNGDYNRAEYYARQVLLQEKGNKAALNLLGHIKSARDFEKNQGQK